MKALMLLAIIFIPQVCFANKIFNSIEVNENSPYLLTPILEHLKNENIEKDQAKDIILSLRVLNQNLEGINPLNQKFFITSEVYKAVLNYKFKKKTSIDTISILQVKAIEEKLSKFKPIYSSFSQFVIQSVLLDLNPFLKDGLLDRFQNLNNFDSSNYTTVKLLRNTLKYSGRWANYIHSAPPIEFNQTITELIHIFLKNASNQSILFHFHAPELKEKIPLFSGLQKVEVESYLNQNETELKTVSEENQINEKAIEAIKKIQVDPIDQAHKEIDAIINSN